MTKKCIPPDWPTPKTGTMPVWWSYAAARASRRKRSRRLGSSVCARRQDLQCHTAAQSSLFGLVDDAHPPAANLPDHAVVAQPL